MQLANVGQISGSVTVRLREPGHAKLYAYDLNQGTVLTSARPSRISVVRGDSTRTLQPESSGTAAPEVTKATEE